MRVFEKLRELHFGWVVKTLSNTPPLELGSEPCSVLSMVQHQDVFAYLLAIKSLARFLKPEGVILIADTSINEADRVILRKHIPSIVIREASEFKHVGLPTYSSWRRLCAIAEYVAQGYIVQLDADTVTIGNIPEVASAVRANSSFILATEDDQDFVSCAAAAAYARTTQLTGSVRPQGFGEAALDRIGLPNISRYVRGCAGFAGYAKNSFNLDQLHVISDRMAAMLGDTWTRWGTEQFTTNLLISNTPDARVLPHPKYCSPSMQNYSTAFLHFIGYERYLSSLYARLAREVAADLLKKDR